MSNLVLSTVMSNLVLLTQLIKPNYLVIFPTDAAPQFLYVESLDHSAYMWFMTLLAQVRRKKLTPFITVSSLLNELVRCVLGKIGLVLESRWCNNKYLPATVLLVD